MDSRSSSSFYAPKIVYDGKRMRKAVTRKAIDYSSSMLLWHSWRSWSKSPREAPILRPTPHHTLHFLPPREYRQSPIEAVTMRFAHTSTNKVRCPLNVVRWTPEGRRLITGAASGEFTLWNGQTFNFETIQQAHDSAIRAMAWNHAGSWMLSGDQAGCVKVWMPNLNNLKCIQAHREPVRDISFSPSDSKFATCSDDGTIRVWDLREAMEERCLTGHGWDVKNAQWHPSKNLLASGSKDNLIKLWDAKSGANLATLHGHKNTILDVKWNRNGNWLISAGKDQVIRMWDIRQMAEIASFRGHRREIMSLAWHPHHESLWASGGTEGSILWWSEGHPEGPLAQLEAAHEGIVWSLDWHPVGHLLASGSNDNTLRFWTRARAGDLGNDKFAIGRAASEALGVKDVERISMAGAVEEHEAASVGRPSPPTSLVEERQLPGLGRRR